MYSSNDRIARHFMREFHMYHRHMLSLIESCENMLKEEPTDDTPILREALVEQMGSCQIRLESMTSELFDQDDANTEAAKVSEKTNATFLNVTHLIGTIRATQIRIDLSRKPNHQSNLSSTINQLSFGLNTSLLQTKMPKLKLPNFDGDEKKFLDFKNHFTKVVDQNETLSALDKLYYLKSALSGRAERLIRDIPISDENYVTAWKTILERYEDNYR